MHDDFDMEVMLRNGLREMPQPDISADFDRNVLAAVTIKTHWTVTLWSFLKPFATGAACSFVVMGTVLFTVLHMPTENNETSHDTAAIMANTQSINQAMNLSTVQGIIYINRYTVDIDKLIDNPNTDINFVLYPQREQLSLPKPLKPAPMEKQREMPAPPKRRASIRKSNNLIV